MRIEGNTMALILDVFLILAIMSKPKRSNPRVIEIRIGIPINESIESKLVSYKVETISQFVIFILTLKYTAVKFLDSTFKSRNYA